MSRPWESDAPPVARPNLEQLKKLAKELRAAVGAGEAAAVAFIGQHHPGPAIEPSSVRLADAQLVLARHHGAVSWPALVQTLSGPACPAHAPMLPLRGMVMFPGQRAMLHVGRPQSLRAVHSATAGDGLVVCVSQRDPRTAQPSPQELYEVGTLCQIVAVKPLPDNPAVKVRVEGTQRVRVRNISDRDETRVAQLEPLPMPPPSPDAELAWREAVSAFERFARERDGVAHKAVWKAQQVASARDGLGLLLQHLGSLEVDVQQRILEATDPAACLGAMTAAFVAV